MNSPWIYRLRFPGIEQRKVLTLMGGVRDDFNRILNLRPEFSRQRRESVAGGGTAGCVCRQGLGSPRRSGGEPCQATLGVRSAWEQSRVLARPPADGPASWEGVRALCALDDANGRLDGGLSHGKPRSKASSWKATAVIPAGKGQAWGALGEWTELGDS